MKPIADVNEMRKIQMDILLFIHQFCIDNGIQYSLAWGTMLGAIRHKGYIPWDDDIDIMKTRPEYDRFCKLFHDERSIYKLYDVHTDKKWIYPFAKISDERTIRVEKNALDEIGINIDVFPIDFYADSYEDAMKALKRMKFWKKIYVAKILRSYTGMSLLKNIIYHLYKIPCSLIPLKFVLKKFDEISCVTSKGKTAYCGFLVEATKAVVLKSEIFDKYAEYQFEGHRFHGVKNYESYLRTTYGDYMTPPPIDQRCAHEVVGMYWK